LVQDHPFAAVSNENGELEIKGLPAGGELKFRVWSEAGTIGDVKINGTAANWAKQQFGVDIKPGMNDLGTVVIPMESLKAQ
jgi:hypothetical protein